MIGWRLAVLACVAAIAPAAIAPPLLADSAADEPVFSRHVVPLLSRLGCNAGICHGAVKGQNGFRLSLFGADPAGDHERLLREAGGRRINLFDPKSSLLLLKATGQVAHRGGKRLTAGSSEYRIVHDWIAAGAPLDSLGDSRVARLTIDPAEKTLRLGEKYALRVTAEFADGSSLDVTSLCTFDAANKEVARIDASGQVEALGIGDTALVARYRAEPVVAMLIAPRESAEPLPDVIPVNFIDVRVLAKLRRLNVPPGELCDDATFLRRVSLDVVGLPPTPGEIREFLADARQGKRARKIDELLGRPGHAALWATKFCDILKPSGFDGKFGFTEAAETRRFYEWLRTRLQENTAYDQLVERILLATSREGRSEQDWVEESRLLLLENTAKSADLKAYSSRHTLDLFWQRTSAAGVKGTLQVAHAFLGLRLECAQCHRHPHDIWQQDDLLSFANFFMRVSNPAGGSASPAVTAEAERLAKEAKDLKEEAKKIGEQAKDKSLAKEEMTKLQEQAKAANDKAAALEAVGRRLKAAEIRNLEKAGFASVTSTLGKQESKQFRMLGSKEEWTPSADADPRQAVMDWLRQPDNPLFARAIVNRVWAHYFGRGIIEPADQLSPLNPPSHPELLAELSADFVRSGYNLAHLHRTILHSRTYQQSARTSAANRYDATNYASFYPRRLPAEVLVDALNHATGGSETYPPELFLPAGARAMEVAGGTGVDRSRASLQYAFQVFGRPLRNPDVQCDCERDTRPTIVQTLYLANHPAVQQKISSPTGRVAEIISTIPEDSQRIDELFLWTLCRLPTDDERQTCQSYIAESSAPQRGYEDLQWSLLNTKEFLLNF